MHGRQARAAAPAAPRWTWVVALAACCLAPPAARGASWTSGYVRALPDSAFAAVEHTADGRKVRHLPHHDARGRVDLPHVRNALSRWPQVHWIDPRHAAAARAHLVAHLRALHAHRRSTPSR